MQVLLTLWSICALSLAGSVLHRDTLMTWKVWVGEIILNIKLLFGSPRQIQYKGSTLMCKRSVLRGEMFPSLKR